MRFAIFSHVCHHTRKKKYFGYAPYVREMNLWLQQVEEVEVVAPLGKDLNFTTEAYRHDQIEFTPVPAFDLLSLKTFLRAFFLFPLICTRILSAMHRADHLHLRCPGNIGLLACICQIFFPKKFKTAKYAGNWDPASRQPWTYRLQKWILGNTFLTRNMQVLAYGEWEKQSKNVVPFFTASFSEKETAEVPEKAFSEPLIFLFVGNLVEGKRPLEAVKLVEGINSVSENGTDREIGAILEIYGDGPERKKLETYVRENQLEQLIIFKGSRPLEGLKKAYQKAHFVILPSRSEGWPKAIAEGMFFGCIPIATPVSCVPWMLGGGSRGILLTGQANGQQLIANGSKEWSVVSGQWSEDIIRINDILADPERMKKMSEEAKKWSQQYTLEKFEEAIQKVLFHPTEELNVSNGKPSSAPFRACPDSPGEGEKHWKE